jgi:hypothetical protein
MSQGERRVPRLAAVDGERRTTAEHVRSSPAIRADLDALADERESAVAELQGLEAGRPNVLLGGDDDAAEAHDAKIRKQRRIIERADLRGPILADELREAEERKEAERVAQKQAEAEAAIRAVIAEIGTYEGAARQVADFAKKWGEAEALAFEAKVPSLHHRLRVKAGKFEPEHEATVTTYIDESGVNTHSPYPPGSYRVDEGGRYLDRTGNPLPERSKRTSTVLVPAKREPDLEAAYFSVSLPGVRFDDPPFWPANVVKG